MVFVLSICVIFSSLTVPAQVTGGTSASQGNPNAAQATNTNPNAPPPPPPKPSPTPTPTPAPPKPAPTPTPKPKPKKPSIPRVTISGKPTATAAVSTFSPRFGIRGSSRGVAQVGSSARFSLRLKMPVATTPPPRTGWMDVPLSRIKTYKGSSPSVPKPAPKPGGGTAGGGGTAPAPAPAPAPQPGGPGGPVGMPAPQPR